MVIALESISDPVSLYEPVYSDSEDTLYIMDQIGDSNNIESCMNELSIRDAIKKLGNVSGISCISDSSAGKLKWRLQEK